MKRRSNTKNHPSETKKRRINSCNDSNKLKGCKKQEQCVDIESNNAEVNKLYNKTNIYGTLKYGFILLGDGKC